ncbi:hypothetical protein MASR1M97_26580 [Candidatus Desulfobacillus denitrificans]
MGEQRRDRQVGAGAGVESLLFQALVPVEQQRVAVCRDRLGAQPDAQIGRFAGYSLCRAVTELAQQVAVRPARQEGEVEHRRRRLDVVAGLEAIPQQGQGEAEQVGEVVGVEPGDAVARRGQRHRLDEAEARRPAHVVLAGLAQSAGIRQGDGAIGERGILRVEPGEHLDDGPLQAVAASALGRQRQRRAEQEDAEVGVAADGLPRRRHGVEQAPAERTAVAAQRRRGGLGAGDEILGAHAVAVGVMVHVARLERRHVQPAGGEEGGADGGFSHARRSCPAPSCGR